MLDKKDALILAVFRHWRMGKDYQAIARAETLHQKYSVKPKLMKRYRAFNDGEAKDKIKVTLNWIESLESWLDGLSKSDGYPARLHEDKLPYKALEHASQL